MKKILSLILAAVLLFCLFSGCGKSSATKAQTESGVKLMQDYLDAYIPGGKVLTGEVREENLLGQGVKRYTCEYLHGRYKDSDGEWNYEVNTETGKLYSSKHFRELEKLIGERILKELDLEGKAEIARLYRSQTVLPHHCETFGHNNDGIYFFVKLDEKMSADLACDTVYFSDVLPIAMVDVEGYLDKDDRDEIYIKACKITLHEGTQAPEVETPLCFDGIKVEEFIFEPEG